MVQNHPRVVSARPFLDCLMKKDYLNAEKLCRMILIYEPKNPEALKFHPVILEKLELDKEAEENSDEGGSDEEGDDDDDDDDDDDSDEDSSLGDSSDTDSDDAIIEENEGPPRPDSGIGM
nr:hypothetical protein BaRGS_032573 [Batillaria attramentaria]